MTALSDGDRPRPVRVPSCALPAFLSLLGAVAALLTGRLLGGDVVVFAAVATVLAVGTVASIQVTLCRRQRDHIIASWAEPEADTASHGIAGRSLHIDQTCREIEAALDADEIELWYQPIVHATTGGIAGFEGLVRWRRPGVGVVMPGTFIEEIENTETIIRISDHALTNVLRDLPELLSLVHGDEPYVGINVSVLHLLRGGFAERLDRDAEALGVSLDGLVIELTERSLVPVDDERLAREVAALQRRGILVAIDDFGAGYANLMTLNAIDVDFVKVDRSLVVAAATPRGLRVLTAASDVIRSIGAIAVAEGIGPTESGLIRRLPAIGFDLAQGHVWGEAQPLGELVRERT